jgi:hypothetical protein
MEKSLVRERDREPFPKKHIHQLSTFLLLLREKREEEAIGVVPKYFWAYRYLLRTLVFSVDVWVGVRYEISNPSMRI